MVWLRRRKWRLATYLFAMILMVCSLGACEGGGPRPSPDGPLPPVQTPVVTPISPVVSQTLEGIKVGIQPVAFDAHRVVLAYSLEGPAQPYLYGLYICGYVCDKSSEPVLSLAGKELPWIQDAYTGLYLNTVPPRVGEPVRVQGTVAFDASGLEGDRIARGLPLELSLSIRVDTKVFVAPEPVPTGVVMPTATPTYVSPPGRTLPFAFSFDARFDPQRVVVRVDQAIESNDITMTLKQVDITASETRMVLRYTATKADAFPSQQDWGAYATLSTGSGDRKEVLLLAEPIGEDEVTCRGGANGDGCVFSYAGPSLLGKAPVACILTVTETLAGTRSPLDRFEPPHGTWVFHFTAPSVGTSR